MGYGCRCTSLYTFGGGGRGKAVLPKITNPEVCYEIALLSGIRTTSCSIRKTERSSKLMFCAPLPLVSQDARKSTADESLIERLAEVENMVEEACGAMDDIAVRL